MATNEQDELDARKALYGLIDQAHIEVAVNAGLASYYIEQEIKSRLVSSIEAYVAHHTKEAVERSVRQANISQIENWRDWIKGDKDLDWLVREMDRAIETLKDESLTDENGVFRGALSAPQQSTSPDKEQKEKS